MCESVWELTETSLQWFYTPDVIFKRKLFWFIQNNLQILYSKEVIGC